MLITLWLVSSLQLVISIYLLVISIQHLSDVHHDRVALLDVAGLRGFREEEKRAAEVFVVGHVVLARVRIIVAGLLCALGIVLLMSLFQTRPSWAIGAFITRIVLLVISSLQSTVMTVERSTRKEVLSLIGFPK